MSAERHPRCKALAQASGPVHSRRRAHARQAALADALVLLALAGALVLLALPAFGGDAGEQSLEVTASAYNSLPGQTQGEPNITAWGDRLVPGMKSIAVSRDLLKRGLTHGVVVRIDGLAGEYTVRDKMAKRWSRKIDIYMGEDVEAARQWGVRRVTIRWDGGGDAPSDAH